MKRGLLMCIIAVVITGWAVPSWSAPGKNKEQKISDEVFTKLCKSGTVQSVQYAIRSRGADVNARIKREWHIDEGDTMLICAVKHNRDPEVV